jgi:hypothetical protein
MAIRAWFCGVPGSEIAPSSVKVKAKNSSNVSSLVGPVVTSLNEGEFVTVGRGTAVGPLETEGTSVPLDGDFDTVGPAVTVGSAVAILEGDFETVGSGTAVG